MPAVPASSPKKPYSPPPSASVSIAHEDWSWAWADAIERSVAMAAFSFAEIRALMSFGMAIEAMIAMMATTIINSISVKPEFLLVFMVPQVVCPLPSVRPWTARDGGRLQDVRRRGFPTLRSQRALIGPG